MKTLPKIPKGWIHAGKNYREPDKDVMVAMPGWSEWRPTKSRDVKAAYCMDFIIPEANNPSLKPE